MLKLFLSVISFFNIVTGLSINSTYMNQYIDYIKYYKKDFFYDNFLIFKDNLQLIENHKNKSYDLEINQFSDH